MSSHHKCVGFCRPNNILSVAWLNFVIPYRTLYTSSSKKHLHCHIQYLLFHLFWIHSPVIWHVRQFKFLASEYFRNLVLLGTCTHVAVKHCQNLKNHAIINKSFSFLPSFNDGCEVIKYLDSRLPYDKYLFRYQKHTIHLSEISKICQSDYPCVWIK